MNIGAVPALASIPRIAPIPTNPSVVETASAAVQAPTVQPTTAPIQPDPPHNATPPTYRVHYTGQHNGTDYYQVFDYSLRGHKADLFNEVEAASAWYMINGMTSAEGRYGRKESLDSTIKVTTSDVRDVTKVTTLGDYRADVVRRLKTQGWWDGETGQPRFKESEINKEVVHSGGGRSRINSPVKDISLWISTMTTHATFVPDDLRQTWQFERRHANFGGDAKKMDEDFAQWKSDYMSKLTMRYDAGDIAFMAKFNLTLKYMTYYNQQMARGAFNGKPFTGSWGDRTTTSAAEFVEWINLAATGRTSPPTEEAA